TFLTMKTVTHILEGIRYHGFENIFRTMWMNLTESQTKLWKTESPLIELKQEIESQKRNKDTQRISELIQEGSTFKFEEYGREYQLDIIKVSPKTAHTKLYLNG